MDSEGSEHAESNKQKTLDIFRVFDLLTKSSKKKERSCAALIDFLKDNNESVGSNSTIVYSAKRLIRGLAATEIEKQNVSFAALSTALSVDAIPPSAVLEALKNIQDNVGSTKSEKHSIHMATVLTYGALISSNKLQNLNNDEKLVIVDELLDVCNSEKPTKSCSSVFLVEMMRDCSKAFVKTIVLPSVTKVIASKKHYEDAFMGFLAFAYLKHVKLMASLVDKHFGGREKFLENIALRGSHLAPFVQSEIIKAICFELSLTNKSKPAIELWKKVAEQEVSHHKWNTYVLLYFQIMLDVLPEGEKLSLLLTPKFLERIIKSLQVHTKKNQENEGYKRAKEALGKLTLRVSQEEKKHLIGQKVLRKILASPCGADFDKKTKTATVQSLAECLSSKEIGEVVDDLISVLEELAKNEGKNAKNVRDIPSIVSLFIKFLNHPEMRKTPKLVAQHLKFLFDLAFLNCKVLPDLLVKVRDLFYKAIELNLAKLENIVTILNELVEHAESKLGEIQVALKEETLQQWKKMLETNRTMAEKTDSNYVAIRALLLHMGLLIFREETLASSTIDELLQCYERIKKKVEADEPHWVEVTVDLLLAMLSQENKLLRHVVSTIFPSITQYLTATAVQQIVDALDPEARNDVLKHADSDESSESESDEGDDFDETDEEETVNDKLRMAVRNALGYSAALTDDESVDMDEMNEEEEKRLNESLSNAFRLFRTSSKKKQSKYDEALMHFRIRVLDLIEIIITNNPPLASCLELLGPLFDLLEFSIKNPHQKPLQNRLEAVLKKLGNVKKFESKPTVPYKDLVEALKRLYERDSSGMICIEMAPAATECSGMLLRAAQSLSLNDLTDTETIENIIATLLDRHFLHNDRKVPYSLFQMTFRVLWEGNWTVWEKVCSLLLDNELKIFKKIKLIELLEVFYKNERLHSTATDDCKKKASKFESKFVKKFIKMLTALHEKKGSKLLPAFYGKLVFFTQMAMQSRTKYRESCAPVPDWPSVVSHLIENMHLISQQKAKGKLVHLAKQYNIPIPDREELKKRLETHNKNMENESTETSEERQPVPIKKKKKVEVQKLMKESRKRREMASSEGLEDVNFSTVSEGILNDELEEEPVRKKPKETLKKKSVEKK